MTDLDIAQSVKEEHIRDIASKLQIPEDQLEFYEAYIPKTAGKGNDLIVKIRLSQQQMKKIQGIRAILLFPEGGKKYQLQHLNSIVHNLDKLSLRTDQFIETSLLSKTQVENLCKTYHPKNLFRLERLAPMKKKNAKPQ